MKLCLLLLLELFAGEIRAQNPRLSATLVDRAWGNLPAHPRLFADAARWGWVALKRQLTNDPVSRQIFALVRNSAERVLDQPPVAYVATGAFRHGPMQQAQGRILTLAMTYRLTGDARFLARAKMEMQTMADLPNWYPQHFLDTAEGALGMAAGLDRLHDALTPQEREHFETALIEKALRASLEDEEKKSWISGTNKRTEVCHGGLVVGALAVAERALKNMPRFAELDAPSGAYSESRDHWAYGTTFMARLIAALE